LFGEWPRGTVNSSFRIRVLQNLKELCTEPDFGCGIILCYLEISAIPYEQLAEKKNVRFHEGLPADFNNSGGKPCVNILDDLLNDDNSKNLCHLFTKGSHPRNISVILNTKNLFRQCKYYSDISLNAKYIVALKTVHDRYQFPHLARQVLPHDSKGLSQAYLHATIALHGYVLLDLSQDTYDSFRLHLPERSTSLDVCRFNETHKGKLSRSSRSKTRSSKITLSNYIEL